jgi:hypothetical protein
MSVRLVASLAVALILLTTGVASGQNEKLKECLAFAGASDEKAFLAFDRELRLALSSQDPTLLTLLAAYPLRVNEDTGTTSIENARTLYARSMDVFPARTRSAVLGTTLDKVICRDSGLGYGSGDVWVTVRKQGGAERFVVGTVNLADSSKQRAPAVVFVCRADDQRATIDRRPDGSVRFRSWNRPRTPTGTPDLEFLSGVEKFEGSGPCAHRVWSFKGTKDTYDVHEPGCFADSNPPPEGILGFVLVNTGAEQSRRWWCY